eukprot:CAMPEP_0198284816 /NCGR_PEP_ID=MMETSP1449-20131203/4226_1 /TAXON_ID=420275 /ORGANISM="Attheya septentrionalis, Strain CCMP2084" /LENGTH=2325 /DNA_ID=CAMNT_0043982031 /DNA_START=25 /DNA_END=7002 /DNA_ORIENTATION=-
MDPHAYHRNLPSHYMDPADGIPYVTKYAEKKARAAIKLLKDIHLTEDLFLENDQDINMDEDEEDENSLSNETLASITKKCGRVAAQLNTLVSLKHTGITEEELCDMILHVLRLLTATVSISDVSLNTSPVEESEAGSASNESETYYGGSSRHVVLRFENVGRIITYGTSGEETIRYAGSDEQEGQDSVENKPDTSCNIEKRLSESFALPSPARESLLSIVNMLLSKKAPLRSASNMAIFLQNEEVRMSLIIDWKALLRMLLRTAPYLDEHKAGDPPSVSSSRQGAVLKRTVNLIRHCRRHFEQGVRPGSKKITDQTAIAVWNMVKTDLLHRTHSNSCFRAIIILYLFQPSCCSSDYYANVMPSWLESWNSIDRSQEFDFLWLVMFCRARKYVHLDAYDWGPIRRRLLTLCGCWLQIPGGGSTGDKSFPKTASPRWRNFPPRLKSFVGGGSSYQEGMDFVGKVSKLLVYCIGKSDSPCSIIPNGGGIEETNLHMSRSDTMADSPSISDGTEDLIRFFSFVAPYFNPSNIGNWSYPLGAFLHYFSYELCHRVGLDGGLRSLMESHPLVARKLCEREPLFTNISIPEHELVIILNALLPLCQQGLYSKNGHVGRAAETALLYLVQIDPIHICPPCLDFATRALDISSVNLSHQAPAALSALNRLIQPALRRNPAVLLTRLPSILSLSLAGIDSNDQNKTIRTLILYRAICYWVPVGSKLIAHKRGPESTGSSAGVAKEGTIQFGNSLYKHLSDITSSKKYEEALNRLPEDSLLYQGDEYFGGGSLDFRELLEETGLTMCDWSLSFLDRIYMLFRAAGEQEKAQHARNFSRVLKDCLEQFFSSMDSETFQLAIRSVSQFLTDETLKFAAKDISALCQAICCARNSEDGGSSSPGLDALVPILSDDLCHQSQETALYRIRCLSGAVRNAGHSVLDHRESISQALKYALSITDNKHLFKAGCKLLRHTLSSQCDTYPLMPDCTPRMAASEGDIKENLIGKSAQLRDDPIQWHIPNGKQIDFTYHLIEKHGLGGIHDLGKASVETTAMDTDSDTSIEIIETPGTEKVAGIKSDIPYTVDLPQWRRALRILRYTIRGCAGILLDADDEAIFSYLPPLDPVKQGAGVDLSGKPSFASFNDDCDNDLVPHEKAVTSLLQSSTADTQKALFGMRGRLCAMISSLASLIARETADCHTHTGTGSSPEEHAGSDSDSKVNRSEMFAKSLSIDRKVCEEVTELSSLLLTRRGSSFRCQDAKAIWKAQKQMLTDFVLASQAETVASALQRVSLYSVAENNVYKDGEGGGKCISRRLLAIRLNLFHQGVQRNASYEIPRRMRRKSKSGSGLMRPSLFTLDTTLQQLLCSFSSSSNTYVLALDGYEGIIDGLFSLSCHPNVQVRCAATIIDYALTRFGWMARSRVSRILSALSLKDEEMRGKFGIPSCSQLSRQLDAQGKRTRLAEVLKGVCSLTAVPRTIKEILGTETTRLSFVKTFCGTQKLIAILPPEEMQKMILYFHSIFSQFRNRFFSLPRITKDQQRDHESCITFLLDILVVQESTLEEKDGQCDVADNGTAEASSMHWRNRLIVGWFITSYIDTDDLLMDDQALVDRLWKSCFHLIKKEVGQPLQRVAVGLFGRLVTLTQKVIQQSNNQSGVGSVSAFVPNFSSLIENLKDKSFCRALGTALVFDHKEDTSVGGGHNAQWSTGVEDILKDALSNVAPRTLFPFQRAGRSSSTLILQHAQLVHSMLLSIGRENASIATEHFLAFAKEMAATPPSEDQRNEQCTAAEIFAGVCRTMMELEVDPHARVEAWKNSMIPFLDEVIPKTPTGQMGIYYDSLRYAIHQFPSGHYLPLTEWIIEKVVSTLWQPDIGLDDEVSEEVGEPAAGASLGVAATDGFAYQSKWLFLATAILVELNDETEEGIVNKIPWYKDSLTDGTDTGSKLEETKVSDDSQDESWVLVSKHLLPRLLNAVGHPYEKCRDHISGCLYRICCCHRKFRSQDLLHDPSRTIVEKFCSISASQTLSFKDRHNTLITARKFMAYCVHLGDYKHEFSECIIPLIPLSFEALKATIDDSNVQEEDNKHVVNAASRALEAEVVKGFRYSLSEISSHCLITYGKEDDMSRILETVKSASKHEHWQIRQASAHYLRCFQGCHKFLFGKELTELTTVIVAALLADERREVSSAAMAALTGILAATPLNDVIELVDKYVVVAKKSAIKKKKKKIADPSVDPTQEEMEKLSRKEKIRAKNQQTSVFFLCAAVLAQPYDTPPHVPVALAALSKHSYERSAPLSVREAVKLCCSEFKRTHMSDNWDVHKKQFSQEQLEALDDVVSTPHYYA